MYRTALALIPSAFALAVPSPALANWESISRMLPNSPERCGSDQSIGALLMRASENRPLRVAAGSIFTVEVFGHGIDLPTDITFDGGTVTRIKGYGGAANVGRRCGAIGSVKLDIKIPTAAVAAAAGNPMVAERATTLRIGTTTIPITIILPSTYRGLAWTRQSGRTDGQPLAPRFVTPPSNTPVAVPPGQSPAPPQVTFESGPTCQETQTCGSATGVRVLNPGASGGSSVNTAMQRTLFRCIETGGGDARIVNSRLEIMLPDDRVTLADCLARPSFASAEQEFVNADVADSVFQANTIRPALRVSVSGGSEARGAPELSDNNSANVTFTRAFTANMLGTRDFRLLASNFAGRTLALDLRVQSVVPFGVNSISAPTQLASTGGTAVTRIGGGTSTAAPRPAAPGALAFNLNLAASDVASRPLVWQVLNSNGQPGGFVSLCFTAGSGTLAPAAGVNRVAVNLQRTANTACPGSSFVLVAAPNGRLDHALYRKRLEFTLN
ncbi:hypothetical protein [Novosphingobium sp.]|uniref:hypothetical protein n=1 Tax=Novosphingobium sp. TaxID=1874826 RepID=UPI0027332D25|nr:hypothetical protein [Novosphingobium sp.]MDP3907715.1 hypothetical protein [Novosphingobium sp.]